MTGINYFPASAMPDDDWWEDLWPDPKGTLAKVGIAPGMTVIDLCCGNGHFTVPLASFVGASGKIIAVDMDGDMLAMARLRLERDAAGEPVADCEWIKGDACEIDLLMRGKGEADVLIMANTFHGVPEQTLLSAAVARVLRPAGCFTIINWHARPREETTVLGQARGPKTEMRMTPQDVEDKVAGAGFALVKVIDLPPYHYAAVFQVAQEKAKV